MQSGNLEMGGAAGINRTERYCRRGRNDYCGNDSYLPVKKKNLYVN